MRTFLINLDRDTERLAVVKKRLVDAGVAFERTSAVYGKDLSGAQKNAVVSRFRWWCAIGRRPTDGEIGCALSHQAIYRKMIDESIPIACVLEDDVVVDQRIQSVIVEVQRQDFGNNPVVVLLSNHSDGEGFLGNEVNGFRTPESINEFSLKRSFRDMFTEGYVVTLAGARALLRANRPLITPCDQWTRWSRLGLIELYHAFPTVCSQDKEGFASSTLPGMRLVRDMNCFELMMHKVMRVIGKTIDVFLIKCIGH